SSRCIANITKAVAAQHRTRVNYYAIADAGAGVDGYARIDFAIFSDGNSASDHAAGADPSSWANARILANTDPGIDSGAIGNGGEWENNGCGMNSGSMVPLFLQDRGSKGKGEARISGDKQWLRYAGTLRKAPRDNG